MSTPNLPVYVRYIGNENATEFSVTFPYIDKKYVKVYLARNRNNTPELLDETRYSFVNDTTIQFPIKDDDALLGYNDALIILRKTDLGSDYDFDNQRRLFPEDVMNADDLAFQQIQELAYEVSRAIKTSIVDEETADDLLNGIYDGVNRADTSAARAEDALDSVTALANDVESNVNIAVQSATTAQESALSALSSKEYAEQAVMNENLITVANDLDSQDSNIKAVAQNMQSVKDAIISAERAAQSATEAQWYAEQAAQSGNAQQIVNDNIGRLNQIGYYGTLVGDTLTFEKPVGEEEYELKKGFTYLVDLLFEAVGELDDSIKVVIKNNDNNINIVNVIHNDPDVPITVGELKQIMRYNTVAGWRWIFNAWYTETQGGSKVLVMPSTVVSGLPIKIENVSVASGEWTPSTIYDGFGYEVMIHLVGVKSTHTPTVIFDVVEATSGNFAPVAISEDEAVTIFAKEQPAADIVIPVIVLE